MKTRSLNRRRSWTTLALSLSAVMIAPFAVSASAAAWTDYEQVNGSIGMLDCAVATGSSSAAASQLLGGEILGTSLASIASLAGVSAQSDGTGATVQNSDPLSVTALSAINANLGGALQLDLGAQTGAVRQLAIASPSGQSHGATGAVTDAGGIDLQPPVPGSTVPQFATLELGEVLSSLVGSGLGGGIAGLADVRLTIGALASFADLDGCAAEWDNAVYPNLERDYLAAGLGVQLDSPLVGALASTVNQGTATIDTLVSALAGDAGLVNSLTGSVLSSLAPTLAGFGLGTPTATLALDVDLSAVTAALTAPIKDSQGILSINLGAGTVDVDLARLLGPAYEDSVGLNGLAPNTELLINEAALSALITAVDLALTDWIANIVSIIETALAALTVDLLVTVPLSVAVPAAGLTVDAGTLSVSIQDAGLDDLLSGTADITASVALTSPSCAGLVGIVVCGVVNPLLTTLTSAVNGLVLDGVLGPILGGVIDTALNPIPGLNTLLSSLGVSTDALLGFLGGSLDGLFGPDAVLSLIVNAQNAPDPSEVSTPAGAEPAWTGLDAPSADPFTTGEFSVAALRLVTLGFLSGGVAIDLARSSVGSNG